MLAGKTMYSGSCSSVMRAHIDSQPPKLKNLRGDVPERLVEIVGKMTAKSPIDRYQSPDDVQKELEVFKLDLAGHSGELPTSKSGILNVINAEKERIVALEKKLKEQRIATYVWMGAAIAAIALAGVFAAMWAGSSRGG
jgi:serine/threonine protein kinase